MFHIRVGLVPVSTRVGEAVSVPTGIEGLVADCENAKGEARAPMAQAIAARAAIWLDFMAGCMA